MPQHFSGRTSNNTGRAFVILACLVLMSSAPTADAQSGRHPPKRPASPDPLPPKAEEPPVKPSSDQESKSKIPVKVVWHLDNVGSSTIYSRTVQAGCLERLSQSGFVSAATASSEMNRKQAIDIAKASPDTYVLWFQLEPDVSYTDRGGLGSIPSQYLIVRFELYTPGTGKTKTGGSVYQRSRGPGGTPLPLPGPGTNTSAEYSLSYAGREMADRVLNSLGVSLDRR